MRTTLDIDDEVLIAVKELARRQGSTTGQVLSSLARQANARCERARGVLWFSALRRAWHDGQQRNH